MIRPSAHQPAPDLADLREMQYRLAVVQQHEAFLLQAIDYKQIEVDGLEHPEVGVALVRLRKTHAE